MLAHFLHDLEFDGQAVAIPTRHVRRVAPAQRLVADNDVLKNLIERRANMHIAIGEGGPIVQNKSLRARPPLLDLTIKPAFLPLLEPFRLARHQVRLHREIGLGQIQCILIFHFIRMRNLSAWGKGVNAGNSGQNGRSAIPERGARIDGKLDPGEYGAGT